MIKYAEILNNRVRFIGEAPTIPEFRPPLFAVDLTDVSPIPKEGWIYKDGAFILAEKLSAPPPPESMDSKMNRILDKLDLITNRLPDLS